MNTAGCEECIPYAWRRQVIKGVECCVTCGRIVEGHELVIVTSAPPPPHRHENPWARGVRKDERGIPYLDANGQPLLLGEPFNPRKYGKWTVTV